MGINMGKSIIEERGRVIIPKEIRKELNLKPGQEVIFERKEGSILMKPAVDQKKFFSELRGCVKKSKIRPGDIKEIWRM